MTAVRPPIAATAHVHPKIAVGAFAFAVIAPLLQRTANRFGGPFVDLGTGIIMPDARCKITEQMIHPVMRIIAAHLGIIGR